ncbi:MAG: hypothetical protein UW68_C0022G0013 [Candidatus Collierbacteria bacterium GW2011_GWB1_44_6]|uniref:Uncharacterized protein n=2 Tax=Candidatus Collieribacteriota TaxID=1752725 RepID=A0A0G1JND6_9BACT|nr:MAG: hypothetical protein UV68_C0011G0007 [Candidatus Collierbacteria bacterium GW2011_GWC2_43_12]KKT72875.1 MAG: hypothetical protein UW68_C0022G0013 [Candidatus Collierbacteria bacterium GW2011_GWB1_44_6]KKT82326.1 MAG: hypothetical protein UW80_C0039G0004 [Microgenomates group bacterium GW2011_GWC1_44_9]
MIKTTTALFVMCIVLLVAGTVCFFFLPLLGVIPSYTLADGLGLGNILSDAGFYGGLFYFMAFVFFVASMWTARLTKTWRERYDQASEKCYLSSG